MSAGDALSICFNVVAILFLCEIDNVLFAVLMPERFRTRVEQYGRVELGDVEAATLARTKLVHTMLIVMAALISVSLGASGGYTGLIACFCLSFLAFWAGSAVEALGQGLSGPEIARYIAQTTGALLLGLCGWFMVVASLMSAYI